jgi:hypothetical protein
MAERWFIAPFATRPSLFAIDVVTVAERLQKVFNSKKSCLVIAFLMLQATTRILQLSSTTGVNNDDIDSKRTTHSARGDFAGRKDSATASGEETEVI